MIKQGIKKLGKVKNKVYILTLNMLFFKMIALSEIVSADGGGGGADATDEIETGLETVQGAVETWATPLATIALMVGGFYFWLGDRSAKDRVFQILIGIAIVGYASAIVNSIMTFD